MPDFDAAIYAREAARLVGLPIDPAHLPGVVMNLELAARMASLVEGMPIAPSQEAAPVFVAGRERP
jgi:hypothetical protein